MTNNKKLTDEQRESLLRDYRKGVPIADIVKQYGVSEEYPRVLAKRRGFSARVRRHGMTGS